MLKFGYTNLLVFKKQQYQQKGNRSSILNGFQQTNGVVLNQLKSVGLESLNAV